MDLKIKGKQGPFDIRMLSTKEVIEIGTMVSEGKTELHEQYREIVQKCLIYKKTGKKVYTDSQKDKMDQDLGGGRIVKLAQEAMKRNGLMDDDSFDERVEAAEKN